MEQINCPQYISAWKVGNVAMLRQKVQSGIPAEGAQLPSSLIPKDEITFIGKANNGADTWSQGFRIDTNGLLTARASNDNSAIAVTWTAWSVTYITAN